MEQNDAEVRLEQYMPCSLSEETVGLSKEQSCLPFLVYSVDVP